MINWAGPLYQNSEASMTATLEPRVDQVPTTQVPHLLTIGEVVAQTYRDWFDKDVQETPTVSYVWTADQFGHFGLGFQITFLLGWIAALLGHGSKIVLLSLASANFSVWLIKETFDYY